MNINEIQKNSNSSSVTRSSRNYSYRNHSYDFSSYVDVSKTEDVKEAVLDNIEENQTSEELLNEENLEQNNNPAIAYIQSFQNLSNKLFDMGIKDFDENKFFDKDMSKYQINLNDLEINDIKLFEGLTQRQDVSINSVDSQNQTFNMMINGENLDISYKSIEVSKTLFAALDNAFKTGKPIRLDFGNDTSVIIKISKDGKLSADFIPNDKAMEAVLKSALPMLKAKFDEENIPYNELNYRNFNQQKDNQNKNKEKNKDE
ncbi:MAG: hypothetical protein MJ180_02915 [Candidatus Gastranaerophilales bacterium]|nr:hypothetical protein [Candidatus Gastranaerophilales bacterium]